MTFTVAAEGYDQPDVVRMVADVQREYVALYGSPDEAAVEVLEFAPPRGLLLVGRDDGVAVAMGGWRRLDDAVTAEIKRMYVAASHRRRGLARRVLADLEATAADAGVTRLILNTGAPQVGAVALYRAAGYTPTTPFGHYADAPAAIFLAKSLAESPGART